MISQGMESSKTKINFFISYLNDKFCSLINSEIRQTVCVTVDRQGFTFKVPTIKKQSIPNIFANYGLFNEKLSMNAPLSKVIIIGPCLILTESNITGSLATESMSRLNSFPEICNSI